MLRSPLNYRWSCLACGHANAADTDSCAACACPACATSAQLRLKRAAFIESGGSLRADAAASSEPDLSAFDVLARPALILLLGCLPFAHVFRGEIRQALRRRERD